MEFPEAVDIRGYHPRVRGNDKQIAHVSKAIAAARQPVLCAGGGVFLADAMPELVRFAESTGIPVVTTMMGLSLLPTDHPLNMGMIGSHGNTCANKALAKSDLLIMIGTRVADVARARGCRVLTNRRHPDGVSVDLPTLLRESDIITIHTPLNDETRGLIGEAELAMMKDGVVLVNMARGAVTDEAAVAKAVRSGKVGAFGCDVFSVEPFPESHPFYAIRQLDNVLLTPHMSWGAYEARARCLDEMIRNMQAFFAGEMRNRVDV